MSTKVLAGSFAAVGSSASFDPDAGNFNVSLWGTFAGTVVLERSFDGTLWLPMTTLDGTAISWTAPTSTGTGETEIGVVYRLRCSVYTSGTISWRISQ